jgi:predicted RNase H-like HicB family nuclease
MEAKSRKKFTFLSENAMLYDVKKVIQFHIFRGENYYVAESSDLHAVTQGKTLDELVNNIREVIEVALEGEDLAMLDIDPNPTFLANIELEADIHAKA